MDSHPNAWRRFLKPGRYLRRLSDEAVGLVVSTWNAIVATDPWPVTGPVDPDVRSILERARSRSDISDHLVTLYAEALEAKPRVLVELGVRTGESTRALLLAAERIGATLVSVDIDDCSRVAQSPAWAFVRSDDVEFGRQWPSWARRNGLPERVDFLFIDTSHLYEHTKAEIATWFPHLAPSAKVVFHDTNLGRWYRRHDGSVGRGWNNHRGVIRAIEEYLGVRFDEKRPFVVVVRGWLVRHDPGCNGLTVLRRIWKESAVDDA